MYISFACPPVEPLPAWSVVLSGFFDAEESRYVFSCGSCWEEAAPLLWNKLFRPGLLSADGCSGAIGGGRGRRERSRSGSVANVASVSDLGISRLGAGCSEILPLLVRLLAARCRGMVLGFVVGWWVVLCFFLVAGWPRLEEYGACPRPISFLRQDLLRLHSKPACDDTSSSYGIRLLPALVLAWLAFGALPVFVGSFVQFVLNSCPLCILLGCTCTVCICTLSYGLNTGTFSKKKTPHHQQSRCD
jgi:hypothetical protein